MLIYIFVVNILLYFKFDGFILNKYVFLYCILLDTFIHRLGCDFLGFLYLVGV